MRRFIASIKKDFLVLIRDLPGLAMIIVMPMILILVMSLIQDRTFRKLDETGLSVLFADNDRDTLSFNIRDGLQESEFVNLITTIDGKEVTREMAHRLIAKGDYQVGILIGENATTAIRKRAKYLVQHALLGEEELEPLEIEAPEERAKILILFDPVTKASFKQSVRNTLENFTSKLENKITFENFAKELNEITSETYNLLFDQEGAIEIDEIYASNEHTEIIPNSVQHNVPAWTIFAIFFIVIPLTGSIINERQSGCALRIKIMPGSHFNVMSSKITLYFIVGIVQFVLFFLIGIFILPLFGLPTLNLGPDITGLILLTFATILAATSYGVLIGTVSSSHDQAAIFGSVSVMILAAIGGIWVPVFMMPEIMQEFSIVSPLNWSLKGYQDMLIRGYGLSEILKNIFLLLGFSIVTMGIALFYENNTSRHN